MIRHESPLAVIVIYRKVSGCPIVPKRQDAGLPMESTGMFGRAIWPYRNCSNGADSGTVQPSMWVKTRIHIQYLAPRQRVANDHRMYRVLSGLICITEHVAHVIWYRRRFVEHVTR